MVSLSGIDVKFGRIIGAIVLITALIVLYRRYGTGGGQPAIKPESPVITESKPQSDSKFDEVEVTVKEKKCTVTYIRVKPETPDSAKPKVLLLHGKNFNAEIWQEIGTLDKLKESGYEAIAVNLGYREEDQALNEKLKECTGDNEARAEFIHQLVQGLELGKFVLISPSKSGEFSIPYIMKAEYNKELKAFVSIAPSIDVKYTEEDFAKLEDVHILIVSGETDSFGEKSGVYLSKIPNKQQSSIPDAGHVCYKEKPEVWHEKLLTYLGTLFVHQYFLLNCKVHESSEAILSTCERLNMGGNASPGEVTVLDLPVKNVQVSIGSKTCSLTYLEVVPDALTDSKPQLLLLHGARFHASTWNENCGTLAKLKEWGYRAVALDLKPEAPISECTGDENGARAQLIQQIVESLRLTRLVLVSPSKSGEFAIPYIMEPSYREKMAAYIPVAPVIDRTSYSSDAFSKLEGLKALVVQGENDHTIGDASQRVLMKLPSSPQLCVIPKAGHPCYLDNPDFWHEQLKKFLDSL
ncbi:uncharacterized protein [Watersipora subatra]|uniref:uncharacterized protein n=1 Tax=Watersipora subatra TaxID=2589382 RepID=UPI00355B6B3E